jgi:PAS domain-containing protein
MAKLLDASNFIDPGERVDFSASLLEASTEYSIIAKDVDGKIQLFNEGAHRLYGYESSEVVGKPSPTSCTIPRTWRRGCQPRYGRWRWRTVSGKAR